MKLSVSMSESDIALLDAYAKAQGLPTRSAVVQLAVRRLGRADLSADYEAAFAEWDESADRDDWEATVADGLNDSTHAAR